MPQFNVRSVIDYPLGFVVVLGIEGEVLEVRRLALDCGRLGREDVIGRKLWKTAWWSYDDEVAGKVKSAFDQACEGREVRFQTRALLKDNQLIDLDFMLSPFVLNERKLQFIVASAVDISVQKIEDSKNALLVAELTHRLRNLFGLVLGIADTTLVRCPPDVRQEFDNRIETLIAAQDLFQLDSAQRIRFSDLLHSQVLSVVGVADDRILMTGPDFSLVLEQGQIMAMLLYELATNAVKHGGLSRREGRIRLDWNIVVTPEGDRLKMVWAEDGPHMTDGLRSPGYGSFVLTNVARARLGATTSINYPPTGLIWTMECFIASCPQFPMLQSPPPDPRPALDIDMAMPVDSETLPLRVLVAEDDPMQAFVLTRTIQAAGMIVVGPITDVASGLIEIVAAVPDAAIVDFHLGDTDSTALVSALTAQAVPVLILSGRNKDALKDRFPGCLIVRKPVRPDALINTLAGLVRAKFGNDANLGQKSKES